MARERARATRGKPAFMLAGEEVGDDEVARLESRLGIDLRGLEEELAEHADLYYRAALMRARAEAELGKAERDVLAAEGRAAATILAGNGRRDVPLTDAEVELWVRRSAEVDSAGRRAGEARRRLLLARALESAYEARGRALASLKKDAS